VTSSGPTDCDVIWDVDLDGPGKHVLDGVNMIELSLHAGDEAFLSNYFDHLFVIVIELSVL